MATVSGSNTNTVTVTSSFAEYYAKLAEQYMDAAKEYCDKAAIYAETAEAFVNGFDEHVQSALDSITALTEQCIEEINDTLSDVLAAIRAELDEINGEVIGSDEDDDILSEKFVKY